MSEWYVYVIRSTTGRTYVGATIDPKRRLRQHNGEIKGGAKNTVGFRPWTLVRTIGPIETQKEALREERRIKRLRAKRYNGQDRTLFEEEYHTFSKKETKLPIREVTDEELKIAMEEGRKIQEILHEELKEINHHSRNYEHEI